MQSHVLYHGTSWKNACLIQDQGFAPSGGGLLGPGTYVAHADKASRFAANCTRHDGDSGAVLKVRISFQRAKYVSHNDNSWLSQGYDACRAERTSGSSLPEWCLKHASQIKVLEIRRIACGDHLPAFEDEAMSLSVVRQYAAQAGLDEVAFNEQASVVSFSTNATARDAARFDVYYTTGTIVDQPQPRVRRKVDTQRLQHIFRDAMATANGSDGCHCHSHPRKRQAFDTPSQIRHAPPGAEEAAVSAALQKLRHDVKEAEEVLADHKSRRDEEVQRQAEERTREAEKQQREEAERQRLASEAAAAAAHQAFWAAQQEAERERQAAVARAEEARAEEERTRSFRGKKCAFVIGNGSSSEELKKRENTLKTVTDLTLVGDGFFLARENGDSFWSNLPSALGSRLQEHDLFTKGAVKYVAAGPGSQYYAITGTEMWWSGTCSDSFADAAKANRSISKVAFGEDQSWIVLYADGGSAWCGIPTKLSNKLQGRSRDRRQLAKPVEVALGQNSTFYVKFADGASDYLLPSHVAESFVAYETAGWSVKNVALNAESGDWLLRYDL